VYSKTFNKQSIVSSNEQELEGDELNNTLEMHLEERLTAIQSIEISHTEIIERAVVELVQTFKNRGKLFICGNGGSAADAQHVAAEFVNGMSHPNELHLPAIALTTDSSIITAHSNDYNFDGVFEVQLKALANPGDCVLLLTTSGKSRNIIRALKYCQDHKLTSIVITGEHAIPNNNGGLVLKIPSTNTQVIQELTLIIEHFICEKVIQGLK
jgi:phosphoheptose isomerase